jgi:DNA-binding NarL/FixJ family response regulator
VRTVDHRVSSILGKRGVTSRREAGRRAETLLATA